MTYWFLRPNLWVLDLIVIPLVWLVSLAGIALLGSSTIRARSAAGAVVVALVVAITVVVGSWWQVSSRGWFAVNRLMFEKAATVDPGTDYYGNRLPLPLRYLSVGGRVSSGVGPLRDTRFFPQWVGVPDDAGGYLYRPSGSPEGFDMYGQLCEDPASLGGGWWTCGLK
ncbi:MAG TPA: hypothetical protein PK331_00910 [Gordonia sp. (in: high G+C Gram-positive bacteria)]|uniref:hypothetical protein n=1 Tax=unclassified Gordonia (in: high G+C Gram-positive bacteria) TaxID=2657482 RepID=UPI000FB29CD0|nr:MULTISPECIES: hypothetical protein [unclassified Gordonia (in: high G+C Gram-positive bacteria)]RUP39296.1 MAG: hypothetical protein EKK60_07285 [Gordonia sp. (in: high G+C Gram-positive bacteria)]HNP55733.1 hypothetical protein [Gordonia sp. (in: high G+C Gram-positive bacteria)]HRC49469.1 hypothetical protein [Gordonia sp. (in: high G+C Gram-positive bacteria)]